MDKYKFCKYYKGEEKCPYEYGTPEGVFWDFEKYYWGNDSFNEVYKYNEAKARNYIKENKDKKNFLTSNAPIEQKGFVIFAEEMLEKWMPHKVDMIFRY